MGLCGHRDRARHCERLWRRLAGPAEVGLKVRLSSGVREPVWSPASGGAALVCTRALMHLLPVAVIYTGAFGLNVSQKDLSSWPSHQNRACALFSPTVSSHIMSEFLTTFSSG